MDALFRQRLWESRGQGDIEADEYVAALVGGLAPDERRRCLHSKIESLRQVRPVEDEWLTAWSEREVILPSWLNMEQVEAGRNVFDAWSLDLATVFFFAALPYCYASGRGAAVLANVSDLFLEDRVSRRINVTGQMLQEIAVEGGLQHGHAGYRCLRRVRLLHACVRALLLGRDWDTAARGVPINQEDLLGTQIAFTVIAFDGIARMGHPMRMEDQAAYLHLWALVGHLLGIEDSHQALEPANARELRRTFMDTLEQPTKHGHALMHALLTSIADSMPRFCAGLPAALVRHLAGPRVARMVGVKRNTWSVVLALTSSIDRAIASTPLGRWSLRIPSRLLGRPVIRAGIAQGLTEHTVRNAEAYWPDRF